MSIADFFNDDETPARSSFFNARYAGTCASDDCYKHNEIEQGDGCEYYKGDLMHMRCARAAERADDGN
jgi:hypothetical protein